VAAAAAAAAAEAAVGDDDVSVESFSVAKLDGC